MGISSRSRYYEEMSGQVRDRRSSYTAQRLHRVYQPIHRGQVRRLRDGKHGRSHDPCSGRGRYDVVVMGDYSNGNDGIVEKKGKSVADMKGEKVNLLEFSVSHYLLARAL